MSSQSYERMLANAKKGVSGTGALLDVINDGGSKGVVVLEPGDAIVNDGDGRLFQQSVSPIAYDLWYLKHTKSFYSQIPPLYQKEVPEEYLADALDFITDNLVSSDESKPMRPMCYIENIDDLVPQSYINDPSIQAQWKALNKYFTHLMAYELCLFGLMDQYPSDGVNIYKANPAGSEKFARFIEHKDRSKYVGYLGFPAGQLGVMEVMSIIRQSDLEALDHELTNEELPLSATVCDYFFPPTGDAGKNYAYGRHFIESLGVIPDAEVRSLEWLNTTPIPFDAYEDCAPQQWMRFWIHEEDTFPIPGEFVGVIMRPESLPPHVWWFQDSSPFLYAGNWMETDSLTSGKVTGIVEEAARTDGGIGREYTVKVQGVEIKAYTMDYFQYGVGDRVGILKTFSAYERPDRGFWRYDKTVKAFAVDPDRVAVWHSPPKTPYVYNYKKRILTDTPMDHGFSFNDMVALGEYDLSLAGDPKPHYDYLIIPIEFYRE